MNPAGPVIESLVIAAWAVRNGSVKTVGIVRWDRLARSGRMFDLSPMGETITLSAEIMLDTLRCGPHQVSVGFGQVLIGPKRNIDARDLIDDLVGVYGSYTLDDVRATHAIPKWGPNGRSTRPEEMQALLEEGHVWPVVFGLRDDVQVLARLVKIVCQAGFLGLNSMRDTDEHGEPLGRIDQFRSESRRQPESPDERDAGGIFKFIIRTAWWPLLLEIAYAP